jgi:PHD/YefM family antitoxin component YafN of YafNO toxin-antitoxin module
MGWLEWLFWVALVLWVIAIVRDDAARIARRVAAEEYHRLREQEEEYLRRRKRVMEMGLEDLAEIESSGDQAADR